MPKLDIDETQRIISIENGIVTVTNLTSDDVDGEPVHQYIARQLHNFHGVKTVFAHHKTAKLSNGYRLDVFSTQPIKSVAQYKKL